MPGGLSEDPLDRLWAMPLVLLCAALLFASLAACSDAQDPRTGPRATPPGVLRLAAGHGPGQGPTERQPWIPWGRARAGQGERATWIGPGPVHGSRVVESRIRTEDWERRGQRIWSAPRLLSGERYEKRGGRPRLRLGAVTLQYRPARYTGDHYLGLPATGWVDPEIERAITRRVEGPAFALAKGLVYLILPEGEAPRGPGILREVLSLGTVANGAWRVRAGALSAEGIGVVAGWPVESRLPAGPWLLAFDTVLLGGDPSARATLRVWDGDRLVHESEQAVAQELQPVRHTVRLDSAEAGHPLRWEVEGAPCLGAFLRPVARPAPEPAEPPDPQAAPRTAPPDVIVLLADTLRADSLAAWGGDPRWMPRLNGLVPLAHRFANAQAAATWTLPSHAAFLAGRYPRELGMTGHKASLPEGVTTLAERFQSAGYRTVAITEGAFVSSLHGLAQGFEWFEEHHLAAGVHRSGPGRQVAFEQTIERSLAEAAIDDGRPLLLFVHTYRAHDPYFATPATRRRLKHLELGEGCDEDYFELLGLGPMPRDGAPVSGRSLELSSRIRRYYRGACADLDEGLGRLLDGLVAAGRLPGACLVVTSDHGEAFGEHGVYGHGRGTWAPESHVPLLFQGPGIDPGSTLLPVGLVSLPRTLAGLAGIGPDLSWGGRDLFAEPAGPEPVATYQMGGGVRTDLALQGPDWKLILQEDAGGSFPLLHSYRPLADPVEQQDLGQAEWALTLRELWRQWARERGKPGIPPAAASSSPEQRASLDALGYTGDE